MNALTVETTLGLAGIMAGVIWFAYVAGCLYRDSHRRRRTR